MPPETRRRRGRERYVHHLVEESPREHLCFAFSVAVAGATALGLTYPVTLSLPNSPVKRMTTDVPTLVACALDILSPVDLLPEAVLGPVGSVDDAAARITDELVAVASQERGGGRDADPFFRQGSELAARRTMRTLHLASGGATFDALNRCLASAAKSLAEFASAEWVKGSPCGQALAQIDGRPRTPAEDRAYVRVLDFWKSWAGLADKTRSGMEAGCTNVWGRLADDPFGDLLSGGRTKPATSSTRRTTCRS